MEIEEMSDEIFYSYLAGLMDSDGCFCIPIALRKTGNKTNADYVSIRPMLRIGWAEYTAGCLQRIRDRIGAGKIYVSNKGKNFAVIYWQTTNWGDTVDVSKKILPYILLKREQCKKMIYIGEKFIAANARNRKNKPKDLILEMAHISCTMNPEIRQTLRYRESKNFDYWKDIIEKIYPKNEVNTITKNVDSNIQ